MSSAEDVKMEVKHEGKGQRQLPQLSLSVLTQGQIETFMRVGFADVLRSAVLKEAIAAQNKARFFLLVPFPKLQTELQAQKINILLVSESDKEWMAKTSTQTLFTQIKREAALTDLVVHFRWDEPQQAVTYAWNIQRLVQSVDHRSSGPFSAQPTDRAVLESWMKLCQDKELFSDRLRATDCSTVIGCYHTHTDSWAFQLADLSSDSLVQLVGLTRPALHEVFASTDKLNTATQLACTRRNAKLGFSSLFCFLLSDLSAMNATPTDGSKMSTDDGKADKGSLDTKHQPRMSMADLLNANQGRAAGFILGHRDAEKQELHVHHMYLPLYLPAAVMSKIQTSLRAYCLDNRLSNVKLHSVEEKRCSELYRDFRKRFQRIDFWLRVMPETEGSKSPDQLQQGSSSVDSTSSGKSTSCREVGASQ